MAHHDETIWTAIEKAGGVDAYILQQLKEKGYLVERKATDLMSPTELDRYKTLLKKEAAERKKIKQEAWKIYKHHHIVYLGQGIYWNDEHTQDIWDLPDGEVRLSVNQLPNITTPKQLAERLDISILMLKRLCYQRDAATTVYYRRFEIPKRQGGMREIWAPYPTLMRIQRWILKNILNGLLVHGAAHGFMLGRSIATNAAEHLNSQVLIKADIQNFFPTIGLRRVRGVFRKAGYNEQIATLLALLCTESPRKLVEHQGKTYYIALSERCLPQGAPTSPALTNILCLTLDRRLTGLANHLGFRYTRYADDLTFSRPKTLCQPKADTPDETSHLLGALGRVLTEEGFALNRAKTHIIRANTCQQVTGLVVNDAMQTARVARGKKREIRAALHNLTHGKGLKSEVTIAQLEGYISFIAMTEPV